MPITPQYFMSLEQRMQLIQEQEYAAMSSSLWAPQIYRTRDSQSRKELLQWFISTATITDQDEGGNIEFDKIEALYTSIENKTAGRGLELKKEQMDDIDGGGAQMAAQWVRDISQVAAYWPQLQTAKLMIGGTSATDYAAYDGKAFFATDHYVNPVEKTALNVPSGYATTYRNLHSSSNALPIDDTVSVETAYSNISKLISYLATIPTSNGLYPRHLQPIAWFVPPRMGPRAAVLTSAKFIASVAESGKSAGTLDVQGLVSFLGMGMPTICPELSAAFGGSDTTYYVLAAARGTSRSVLGPIIYIPREPFGIIYHGPQTDAQLAIRRKFQWTEVGRYGIGPGHPFELHRVEAA
jgi:phage major head subunit gpT-like protein